MEITQETDNGLAKILRHHLAEAERMANELRSRGYRVSLQPRWWHGRNLTTGQFDPELSAFISKESKL